jgi:phosphatidylserine/phosphatidylglycerophosphate/cardiolipin synthase-like enzyme
VHALLHSFRVVDMDVLVAGAAVQDLSRSFDAFWNNERAYPVQSLVSRADLDRIRARARQAVAAERERQQAHDNPTPAADGWDQKSMDLRSAELVWAPAAVLADKPAKIPPDGASPDAGAGKDPGLVVHPAQAPDASRPSLDAAADAAANGDTVVGGLLQLVTQAQHDLLIVSPYFVPGPEMEQAFAQAHARGVRIRVLTNSLASNDAPLAHVGYARHRDELLDEGVDLYELRSDQDGAGLGRVLHADSGASVSGASRSMLHSKALVVDGKLLVIGSMNLDQRSLKQNTEVALLVRSQPLSAVATEKIERVLRAGAWHVEHQDGHLVWLAPAGSGVADTSTEPDASFGLRWTLKLVGPLAPDALL